MTKAAILCASLMIYLPDIDECSTDSHSCDDPQRAICTNNVGSFECQCKPGYTGSGFKNDCGIIYYPALTTIIT